MMIAEDLPAAPNLRPHLGLLIGGSGAITAISLFALPWPFALASTLLGLLMIAGADVDARTFLLPDAVTYGALACGLLAAFFLEPMDPFSGILPPWQRLGFAVLRAGGTALLLALLRLIYGQFRGREGLGLGDVKLAAAAGAWLPLDAIPACFGLAAAAALISIFIQRPDGDLRELKLPFGAFFCPALWLVFFAVSVTG